MSGERIRSAHRATHEFFVEGCYGCKISSVVLGKGDTSDEVSDVKRRDAQLDKDRAAYKRLRHDGIQPHSVDGSANLEQRAVEQIDVDFKIEIPKGERERVKDIVAESNMGKSTGDFAW